VDKNNSITPLPTKDPWERHRNAQTLFIFNNTTPAQRMEWLEQMLVLLAPYLPKKGPLTQWPNGEPFEKPPDKYDTK
jgi:hypothetical protein